MSSVSGVTRSAQEEAQARLRGLMRAMAEAARRPMSRDEFFRDWLSGLAAAVGADGGAYYERVGERLVLRAKAQLPDEPAERSECGVRRDALRLKIAEGREAVWLPPAGVVDEERSANDADRLVLLSPASQSGAFQGVVELVLSPQLPPAAQQGCCRVVAQAIEIADDFHVRDRLRELSVKQELIEDALGFVRAIHASVDLLPTAYAIANEGRRIIGCDRLTVVRRRGRRYRVAAVSGQDLIDVRSPAVKALEELAGGVAATGEPLSSDVRPGDLPPTLEEMLARYVDESHAKHVSVVPLRGVKAETEAKPHVEPPPPIGALVVERTEAPAAAPGLDERVRFVAEHATAALTNALEHERLFLLPLWRGLGRTKERLLAPGTRGKTAAVVAAAALLVAALVFVPVDFTLHAEATFQPVERRDVFAPSDGTIAKLHVRHGTHVEVGAPLVELQNIDLELAAAEAVGERTAAQEQRAAVDRALIGEGKQLSVEERVRLTGQRAELTQRLTALDEKLSLLERKRRRLTVVSPIAGEVVTWNVERLLGDRPVKQGQTLVTVADPSRDWELEVYVPERYVGHLMQARQELGGPPKVTFRPTSDPSAEYVGTVKEVHGAAEVRGERGNTVLVTVAFDAARVPALKPGAEATAKVVCGRRSLGYVWLHDVVDFLRAKVWFRMY